MNFPWTNKKDQKIRKLRRMISDLITQDLFMYDKVSGVQRLHYSGFYPSSSSKFKKNNKFPQPKPNRSL